MLASGFTSITMLSPLRAAARAATSNTISFTGHFVLAAPGYLSFIARLPSFFKEPAPGDADPLTLPVYVITCAVGSVSGTDCVLVVSACRISALPHGLVGISSGECCACGVHQSSDFLCSRLGEFLSCFGVSGHWFSLSFLPPVAYWMPLSEGYECPHFRGLPLQAWIIGSLGDLLYKIDSRTQSPILRIRLDFILSSDQEAYRQLMGVIGGTLDDLHHPRYAEALCFFPHSTVRVLVLGREAIVD